MFSTFRGLANIHSRKYNFFVEILKPNFFRRILLNFLQDFSPIQICGHMQNVYVCWQYDFSRLTRWQTWQRVSAMPDVAHGVAAFPRLRRH